MAQGKPGWFGQLVLEFLKSASTPSPTQDPQHALLDRSREQTELARQTRIRQEQERATALRDREVSGLWNPMDYGDRQ